MGAGQVIPELSLRSGMTVADIGAGTSYFTLPILHAAEGVAHVYAVDLQSEMLDLLRAKLDGAVAERSASSTHRQIIRRWSRHPAISCSSSTSGMSFRIAVPFFRSAGESCGPKPG